MRFRSRIKYKIQLECIRNRFFGKVVCSGSESPCQDQQIRPGKRKVYRSNKAIVIIANRSLKVAVNSKITQLLGNILRVCIQNIAHQQLCADGKYLSRHDFAFLKLIKFQSLEVFYDIVCAGPHCQYHGNPNYNLIKRHANSIEQRIAQKDEHYANKLC